MMRLTGFLFFLPRGLTPCYTHTYTRTHIYIHAVQRAAATSQNGCREVDLQEEDEAQIMWFSHSCPPQLLLQPTAVSGCTFILAIDTLMQVFFPNRVEGLL